MKITSIFISTLLFISCVNTKVNMQDTTKPTDKLVVYQIFTRLFGNQNQTNKFNGSIDENGCGKLNDITPKALSEIKKMGITHVWFTGVIEHANMTDYSKFGIKPDNPQVVKGRAGSPYAIKDYYDINPDLAVDVKNRIQEFEALVQRSHEAGLKVLIDFVPNHVSRSYHSDVKPSSVEDFGENDDKTVSFNAQNNFYYLPNEAFKVPIEVKPPVDIQENYSEYPAKATGNDVFSAAPSINDWFETIKLNYGVDYLNNRSRHFEPIPSTWIKMRDILLYWQAKGVDGFRCDMAEMVPVEFWGWVIPQIKAKGNSIFIAEIYNPNEYHNYIFNGKFDYLYDKVGLYDALRRLIEGGGNAMDITTVWQKESGNFANHMLRFLENHDEQRIASEYFAKDPKRAIPAMFLSSTLHDGPLMLYFGQEVGINPTQAEGFQGNDGRTTIFDYWGVPEFQAWVNNGKFDGKKLTAEQKTLRNEYLKIIDFSTKNEAITNGKFWDLQYLNDFGKSKNYDQSKLYSYVRYTTNQKLLVVVNFNQNQGYETEIKFSEDLINTLKLNENITFTEIYSSNEKIKSTQNELIKKGLPIQVESNSFKVFEIK